MKGFWGRIVVASGVLTLLFTSCQSSSRKNIPDDSQQTDVVSIPDSRNQNKTYFSSINPEIIQLVRIGSPVTIRQAVSLLHKSNPENYTEPEKVLIYSCSKIMSIVWPSEKISWEIPELKNANPYSGAIESAQRGIYDHSTGNSDFLTIILPSLVLLTSSSRADYYEDAQAALASALDMCPESVLANYLTGKLFYRLDNVKEALKYFNRAYASSEENPQIQCALIKCYFEIAEYSKSLEIAEKLLEKYPQNIDVLEIAAKDYYELGDDEGSERCIISILTVEPENPEYILFRAKLLMDKQDYIRATSLLDTYARNDETSKDYLMLRVKLQREWNKNNSAAVETMGTALTLYPEDMEVLSLAAELSSLVNMPVNGFSAREIAEKILVQDSENKTAMQICITEMIKKAEWQQAYVLSKKLIENADLSNVTVYSDYVEICLALKKYTEATDYASRLYESGMSDENKQQPYIKMLVSTNQRNQALEMINSLLADSSSKMKSFLYYQKSLLDYSEEDMLTDLRSSLTANPRNRDALYQLYEIYYGKKDWRRAQYYLKQVLALDSSDSLIISKNAELERLIAK